MDKRLEYLEIIIKRKVGIGWIIRITRIISVT